MPTILGANQLDTGYEISNSLRLNDDDSHNVSNNPGGGSGSDGSRTQFSVSMWVKRSTLGLGDNNKQQFLTSAVATNNFYGTIKFNGSDQIAINLINSGSDQDEIITNAVYRDASAWYHLFFAFDKTQASISNGVKLYVNGVLQTFGTTTYTQNQGYHFFRPGKSHYIGNYNGSEGYFDGYMAEVHFVDGQVKAHTDFGETNDNGVWIPKKYTGSHGTYGFYLEFKQTGTSENSSGIGADTSGNDEHFAVANLAAIDVTTDTPTNNYNTLNPLANAMGGTLSEGNLKCVGVNAVDRHVFGTFGLTEGKWYFEIKTTDRNARGSVWVSDSDHEDVIGTNYAGVTMHAGGAVTSGTSNSNLDQAPTDGDIVCYAVDLDNGQLWFSRNADIDTSGTANITGLATSGLNRDYRISQRETGNPASTFEHNYGNAPYAISSSNSDANGYGSFEYAVPSGYYALNTKNLAEFG